ncbi:MAG TPA: TetR/AcrR family transcriptional regulator [Micromonosporaceae bacterium]|nr:TetR/AcrR family transcriptional regulator [Micromonosporaceae bacterium]
MTAASVRARVRAEMITEIKAIARRHLAVDGANLSLRAVARDLGMVSSAIYRYFPSRDELLTALIVDAYDALGDAAERADAENNRSDLLGRWLACCHGVRGWAVAQPHEYALIYGSPVPGYRAPADTVVPATRPVRVMAAILADGVATGTLRSAPGDRLPRSVRDEFTVIRDAVAPGVPETILARGVTAWIQLFGTVSFEVFGQFNNTVVDRQAFFDHQMRTMAVQMGLPAR